MKNCARGLAIVMVAAAFVGNCRSGGVATNSDITSILGQYRTYGASSADLGGYGRKLREGRNAFELLDTPKWTEIPARPILIATVDQSQFGKLENLGVDVAVIGKASIGMSSSNKEEFKIVFLELPVSPLVRQLRDLIESDGQIADDIADADARLVTTVGAVFDYKIARDFERGGVADVSFSVQGTVGKLSIKASQGGTTEVVLGDNTLVAYRFSRFCWLPDGKLKTLTRDQFGSDHCPSGTKPYRKEP